LIEEYFEDEKITTLKKIQAYSFATDTHLNILGYIFVNDSLDLEIMPK